MDPDLVVVHVEHDWQLVNCNFHPFQLLLFFRTSLNNRKPNCYFSKAAAPMQKLAKKLVFTTEPSLVALFGQDFVQLQIWKR